MPGDQRDCLWLSCNAPRRQRPHHTPPLGFERGTRRDGKAKRLRPVRGPEGRQGGAQAQVPYAFCDLAQASSEQDQHDWVSFGPGAQEGTPSGA